MMQTISKEEDCAVGVEEWTIEQQQAQQEDQQEEQQEEQEA